MYNRLTFYLSTVLLWCKRYILRQPTISYRIKYTNFMSPAVKFKLSRDGDLTYGPGEEALAQTVASNMACKLQYEDFLNAST